MNDARETPSRMALHEGAHAVAALELGLVMEYATIRPHTFHVLHHAREYVDVLGRSTGGHVMVRWPGLDVDLEPWVVMLLAADAAERRTYGESDYRYATQT